MASATRIVTDGMGSAQAFPLLLTFGYGSFRPPRVLDPTQVLIGHNGSNSLSVSNGVNSSAVGNGVNSSTVGSGDSPA